MGRGVTMGKCYLLQERLPDGSASGTVCAPGPIIRAFGFRDCTDSEYEVYEISEFGKVTKLKHEANVKAPFNYHKFINPETGEVTFDGYSPEH